ncbi:MAG: hypothetical protein U0165_04895 [Polyangiaceae bacterium]
MSHLPISSERDPNTTFDSVDPSELSPEENQEVDMSSLSSLWKQEEPDFQVVDVAEIRKRANRFATRIRIRNITELGACGLVLCTLAPGLFAPDVPHVMLPGLVAMVLGVVVVAGIIVARGLNRKAPPVTASTTEVIAHERKELERQATLLENIASWYLGPFVPGVLLTLWGAVYTAYTHGRFEGEGAGFRIGTAVALHVIFAMVFAGIHGLNKNAAKKLRAQVEKLPV